MRATSAFQAGLSVSEIEAFEQLARLGVTVHRHQRPAQGGGVGGVVGTQLYGHPEVVEGLARTAPGRAGSGRA